MQQELFTGFYLYQWMMYEVLPPLARVPAASLLVQVWIWDSYLVVGAALLSVVVLSAVINILLAHRAQTSIARMTKVTLQVNVKRSGVWSWSSSLGYSGGSVRRELDETLLHRAGPWRPGGGEHHPAPSTP